VHSDIGGGNGNTGRSNIALNWMLDRAVECGVPIHPIKRKKYKYSHIDLAAKISENKDVKRDARREVLAGDAVHPGADARKLAVGESLTCVVLAELKYNWSGILLEENCRYEFSVDPAETWKDGDLEACGPDGWESEQLPWYKEKIVERFEDNRRYPDANWFEIIGALGDEDDQLLRVLSADKIYTATRNSELYYFANDLKSKYDNNSGAIEVTVKRLA